MPGLLERIQEAIVGKPQTKSKHKKRRRSKVKHIKKRTAKRSRRRSTKRTVKKRTYRKRSSKRRTGKKSRTAKRRTYRKRSSKRRTGKKRRSSKHKRSKASKASKKRTVKRVNKKSKQRKQHKQQSKKKIVNNDKLLFRRMTERNDASKHSYSPSINKRLVKLKSIPRSKIHDCNINKAYNLKEPLQIGVPGYIYGKNCYNYNTPEAKQFLLHNLTANKHINPNIVVPPKQYQSNCWFNAMFAMFFISDKGRKFFHFFRQMMIEGVKFNGEIIPENLRDAFALLNFGVDASLTGNKFAYKLDTNVIIHKIYKSIPTKYKEKSKYIKDVNQSGNPLKYYISIINYLANSPILVFLLSNTDSRWKDDLVDAVRKSKYLPHIIVLEVSKPKSDTYKKPKAFKINNTKYSLDSASIIDTSQQHFCSTLTCNKKEMAYDGISHHPLINMEWKDKINSDYEWDFPSKDDADNHLKWNFTDGYQLLMYYRSN